METQTLDDVAQQQQIPTRPRVRGGREPAVQQARDNREDHRGKKSKHAARVAHANQQLNRHRGADTSAENGAQQAHRRADREQAANPYEATKSPKGKELGMAPSRGTEDRYNGDDKDRLFDGVGNVKIPDGLRKKAGEGDGEKDDGKGKGVDRGGGGGSDDGDDGGGGEDGNIWGSKQYQEEDDLDDILSGYVDAEDDAAYNDWFKDKTKLAGTALTRDELVKIRDAQWGAMLALAQEQNSEDKEWLDSIQACVDDLTKRCRSRDFNRPSDLEIAVVEIADRLKYQPSRRLKAFRTSVAAETLARCLWYAFEDGYWLGDRSHCDLIFGENSGRFD